MASRAPLDQQAVRENAMLGFESLTEKLRKQALLPSLSAVRRARSAQAFADANARLFDLTAALRDAGQERAARAGRVRDDLRRLTREERDALRAGSPEVRERKASLDEQLEVCDHLDRRSQMLHHTVRCIGDALAWRALTYDRAAISQFGQGTRVGSLSEGRGFGQELARVQAWAGRGVAALMNDLTNCLRHGDLTVLHGRWPLEEVKAAGTRGRKPRQDARLESVRDVLETGSGVTDEGQLFGIRRYPTVPYDAHMETLGRVIQRARGQGLAHEQPEDCMVVAALDLGHILDEPNKFGKWHLVGPTAAGWEARSDRYMQSSTLVQQMLGRRDSRWENAYIAPVGIFPIGEEDILDILLGRIDVAVTISADALERAF